VLGDFGGVAPTDGDKGRGLLALAAIDDISLICAPDDHAVDGLRDAVVRQCEQLKDRLAITQLPDIGDPEQVDPPPSSSYAAVYYPWVRVRGPETGQEHLVPPGGHVAGIYARTDTQRGVHKAPANERVLGIVDPGPTDGRDPLSVVVTDRQQAVLNLRGVNLIRDCRSEGRGILVWGARTLAEDTQWVVFEPNHGPTWTRVRNSVGLFLRAVWKSGALVGVKEEEEEEAFFVTCDRTTMTQDDIDNGRLVCLVGMAPVKPAEFLILQFTQRTTDAR
jgi:phage tail sheath protein FI